MENIKLNIADNKGILSETHLFSCSVIASFSCRKLHPGFGAPPTITKKKVLWRTKALQHFNFTLSVNLIGLIFYFSVILGCFRVSEEWTVSV